jgi:hypothetical protein
MLPAAVRVYSHQFGGGVKPLQFGFNARAENFTGDEDSAIRLVVLEQPAQRLRQRDCRDQD